VKIVIPIHRGTPAARPIDQGARCKQPCTHEQSERHPARMRKQNSGADVVGSRTGVQRQVSHCFVVTLISTPVRSRSPRPLNSLEPHSNSLKSTTTPSRLRSFHAIFQCGHPLPDDHARFRYKESAAAESSKLAGVKIGKDVSELLFTLIGETIKARGPTIEACYDCPASSFARRDSDPYVRRARGARASLVSGIALGPQRPLQRLSLHPERCCLPTSPDGPMSRSATKSYAFIQWCKTP